MSRTTYVNRAADRSHEDRVLAALRRHGPLTRAELTGQVQLSRTTVSQVIGSLLASGAIQAVRDEQSGTRSPGRPVERLHLVPSSGHVLGVDLSRRRAHIAVANAAHDVVLSAAVEYRPGSDWPARVRETAERVRLLADAAGVSLTGLHGAGVGLAGPVASPWHSALGGGDQPDGRGAPPAPDEVVVESLAQLTREHFEQAFGVRTITDNNIRFAGLAEAIWGAGAGSPEQLYVRISHGMAGSLITGGEVLTGSAGLAGEIGHVTVDRDGAPCHCGKRGCLEGLVSVPALLARTGLPDAAALARGWEAGDPAVTDAVTRAATRVGEVIAVIVMSANPSTIVLGGDLVEALPAVVAVVDRSMRAAIIPAMSPYVDVRPATLGEGSGARGAIAAVLQRAPRVPSP